MAAAIVYKLHQSPVCPLLWLLVHVMLAVDVPIDNDELYTVTIVTYIQHS